jgi:hypothetical protein
LEKKIHGDVARTLERNFVIDVSGHLAPIVGARLDDLDVPHQNYQS